MKDIKNKRQIELAAYINRQQVVSLDEICAKFGVSLNTVRRDIKALLDEDLVEKVHGGVRAKNTEQALPGRPVIAHYPLRMTRQQAAKQLIGHLAATLVEDGDAIYIDSGTTTAELIVPELLAHKDLLVVTNSLPVFDRLQACDGVRLYGLGGIYMPITRSFTGAEVVKALESTRFNKAFLGASAVSAEFGASNSLSYEIEIKRTAVSVADKVIVMADVDKLGRQAAMRICGTDRLDVLVTNAAPEGSHAAAELQLLEMAGIQVLCE